MNKSKVDYVDRCWNPVTGCLHDCPYCYARGIVRRFASKKWLPIGKPRELNHPMRYHPFPYSEKTAVDVYPFGFDPTLHRYRLGDPAKVKKPQVVFVCDMADLFGEWVPDEWIRDILTECAVANWHHYLFLTKNPKRYLGLTKEWVLPDNWWFGTTIETQKDYKTRGMALIGLAPHTDNIFFSMEPLQGEIKMGLMPSWVIIGADSSNRKEKVAPRQEWVNKIIADCKNDSIPVFLKNNLAKIWGAPLIQEMPEGL